MNMISDELGAFSLQKPKLLVLLPIFANSSKPSAQEEDGKNTTYSSASYPRLPEVVIKMGLD